MASIPNPGLLSVRPTLTRSRSNTSPVNPSNLSIETPASPTKETVRPGHTRSRSYYSTNERTKDLSEAPPTASERSSESYRFPRLHLLGKHQQAQHDDPKLPLHKRHRFMQSDSQQYHRKSDSTKAKDPPSSGSNQQHAIPTDILYPGSRGAPIPSLMRMRSYRSYRGPANADDEIQANEQGHLRGRANSDPKSPTQNTNSLSQRSPIEIQLEKGDLLRYAAHHNVKQEDIDRLGTRLETAKTELSERVVANLSTASTLMQRLDHSHDMLRRTTESLVDTLSSFSSLAQQSSRLLSNFDTETANWENSLKSRIGRIRNEICIKRTDRVSKLERRSKQVSQKAEDLGRRLENCRTIVKNWEARELKKRKTWKDVRKGIFWSLVLIFIGIFAGILSWKAVQLNDGHGTPEELLGKLVKNESWCRDGLVGANLPEDVITILQDIAARKKEDITQENILRGGGRSRQSKVVKEDTRVRLLDEL